jgi:nicotinamide mononucleotide transporter
MNDFCGWLVAHQTSCLEFVAVLFGIAGVWLSVYEKIANWPFGIVNVLLYAILFVQQKWYANAGLQIFYAGVSIYGWYAWAHARQTKLVVQHVRRSMIVPLVATTLVIWVLLVVGTRLAGGAMTVLDSGTTAVSLVAEWMLARKLVENWAVWIAVDAVYVGMLIAGGLYLTAFNYAIYFVLALVGYVQWKRLARVAVA